MAGSRLRLTIVANDARPAVDGHDTASEAVRFTVFHDARDPSALTIPVIPDPNALLLPLPYGAN